MARVAVVGAGSIGACFAAHLSRTHHDVTACVRRPFDEYVIESATTPMRGPADVVTDPADLDGPYDWVLVGVKAHQTADARPWFDTACGPDTVVVALQNGVEAVERLTPLVHGAVVVPGVVYVGAELLEPGRVRHTTRNLLIVPESPEGHALQELYADTPVQIQVDDDHLTKAWLKLATNVVANGLTALTRRSIRVIVEPSLFPVASAMLTETWTVANAEGATIDTSDPETYLAQVVERTGHLGTSMLMDVAAGRPTEHDAIHGAVVRAGARHGIPTPVVETIHGLLDTREFDTDTADIAK